MFNVTNDLTVSPTLEGFVAGDTILINCKKPDPDETFVMNLSSFKGFNDDLIPQVLWNFPDAATVTISGNDGVEGNLLMGNPDSLTTFINHNFHKGRFVTCGSLIHDGGGTFYNYPFIGDLDALPSLSADISGYLFIDQNDDQIRNSGDTNITNAPVSLIADGATIATTNTNHEGYYCFTNVPAGVVTVQVVQATASLVAVPATNDVMRNRATFSAADTAVIEYTVVSGQTSEPLNFGYSSYPLSTRIDFKVYVDSDGTIKIEISTVNENGTNNIEICAMIGDDWVSVATVPAECLMGECGGLYTVEARGLTPGQSYFFRITDDSGHNFESGLIEVARSLVTVQAVTLTPERMKISFASNPDMNYQVMVCEDLGAPWTLEYVWYPTLNGWSKDPTNEPFTAAPGDKTDVLVPRNRVKAFFKVIEAK